MASSGKKKTTMAKLARESRLRERRQMKQERKDARRNEPESASGPAVQANADGTIDGAVTELAQGASADAGDADMAPAVSEAD